MANVQVNTREEYFKAAGEREAMIRQLDEVIQKAAPSFKPILFGGMSGKWLGYGMQPYQSKSMKEPSEWPVIAVANQKNYVSLYVVFVENGEYVAEKYQKDLGKVSVGKSCIRFKKIEDLNLNVVSDLIKKLRNKYKQGLGFFSIMTERPNSGFAKHFFWGAATAAHQIEGGLHNQWTVWELENARTLAAQAEYHYSEFPSWERIKGQAKSPHNYVSGAATDHARRYKEDFDLIQKMNMNAYRFSIEWSRIEPEEGRWNAEAVMYYKEYLKELKRRDIEPVVTLLHFTLPVWFVEKGGFEHRGNVKYFVRYVEKIMTELGVDMKWIITINEPEVYTSLGYVSQMWPPAERSIWKALRVAGNLVRAHNRSAKLIHRLSRKYKVSIAKQSMYVYAGDNSWLSRLSAHVLQYVEDDYFLKKVVKSCDFIGVNYYMSIRVYGYRIHNPETPLSDVNWVMAPSDIELVLERLHLKYKLPIMITENGVADADDEYRQWWIKETIVGMQAAMKRGVRLLGYFHWTLTDNFEWAFGRWPRFGLAAVDYKTGKRTLRKSAVWFGGVIRKLRGI